jgi:hypothetical protein
VGHERHREPAERGRNEIRKIELPLRELRVFGSRDAVNDVMRGTRSLCRNVTGVGRERITGQRERGNDDCGPDKRLGDE